jgi:hypothetical protein
LFHLPGDIIVDRPGFKLFFPITTMVILSAVLSLLTGFCGANRAKEVNRERH